MTTLEHPHCRK